MDKVCKDKPFTKRLCGWLPIVTCPIKNLWSDYPVVVTFHRTPFFSSICYFYVDPTHNIITCLPDLHFIFCVKILLLAWFLCELLFLLIVLHSFWNIYCCSYSRSVPPPPIFFFKFLRMLSFGYLHVTGQCGVQPLDTIYMHNTKTCVEGNQFLLAGFPI